MGTPSCRYHQDEFPGDYKVQKTVAPFHRTHVLVVAVGEWPPLPGDKPGEVDICVTRSQPSPLRSHGGYGGLRRVYQRMMCMYTCIVPVPDLSLSLYLYLRVSTLYVYNRYTLYRRTASPFSRLCRFSDTRMYYFAASPALSPA